MPKFQSEINWSLKHCVFARYFYNFHTSLVFWIFSWKYRFINVRILLRNNFNPLSSDKLYSESIWNLDASCFQSLCTVVHIKIRKTKNEHLIIVCKNLMQTVAEIEAHKWSFLALLVDHILSEVRPATKELSTELQCWASI